MEALLSASWLGTRLGVDPTRLAALHRARRLLAIRAEGSQELLFPVWQFDEHGRARPAVGRVLQAAREAGIDDRRLYDVLMMRAGLTGGRRLHDALRDGDADYVVAAVRAFAANP